MAKIALFGGSFDPPHLGHQLVISYLAGLGEVDQIWVIPVYKHALEKKLVPFEHRFQMVLRMCSIFDYRKVHASRSEESVMHRTQGYVDSRTINLVKFVQTMEPKAKYRLVIGSDLVEQAKTWDDWEEIEKLAPPLVVGRIGYGDDRFMLPNISSSQIKASVKDGSIRKLVPGAVADYIQKVGLYRDAFEEEFHISRRMFVFRNGILYVAAEKDPRSHEQWFEDNEWDDALESCVRGFWDYRGVFLYIGRDWDFNEVVEKTAPLIVGRLKHGSSYECPKGLAVYGGMVPGVPGTLWEPRCRLDLTT